MKISVIIPALNKWELTRACLESLHGHTSGDIEVLLVDNASNDATPAEAPPLGAALFGDDFIYLPQPVNRNFSASCNIGAKAASGELLFFLNNDTLLAPGWLPPLLNALSDDSAGRAPSVVGPLLLYPELGGRADRVQHLGITFEPNMFPSHLYEGFPAGHPLCAKKRRFQAVTGAALLMRRGVFMQAGMFDEDFINGFEDVALGLRLTSMGHILTVIPDSKIYHLASQTPGIHKHAIHNAGILKKKYFSIIFPDLHSFGSADGYELAVSDSLKPYLRLQPELNDNFCRCYESETDASVLMNILDEEPLWHEGYLKLAKLQEAAGDMRAAADTLFMALRFRPNFDVASYLARLSCELRLSKYASFAGRTLGLFRAKYFQLSIKAANFWSDFGKKTNDFAIEKAYNEWLERVDYYKELYTRED